MALTSEQVKVEIDRRDREFKEYLRSEDYQKKLKIYNKLLNRWQVALLKAEQECGVWLDDGHGNCGFEKDEELY